VPEVVVRRRFAALSKFFELYMGLADTWQNVADVDNSEMMDEPRLIATGRAGRPPAVIDAAAWTRLQEARG
jgi:hypothetical protein